MLKSKFHGLEHDEHGTPSSWAGDHIAQLDKRRDKLVRFDYGDGWAEVNGEGETVVLTWGSTTGSVCEAAARARAIGRPVKVVSIRLLMPASPDRLRAELKGARHILVVEQSHSGQFYSYLKSHWDLPAEATTLLRPGPLAIRPAEVLDELTNLR